MTINNNNKKKKNNVDRKSLAQRKHFSQDVFQMIAITLVLQFNHYHINGLHLFWDTLYIYIVIHRQI